MRAILALFDAPQQSGALSNDLLILTQGAAVGGMHLTQRHIEETTALHGGAYHQVQVSWRKDNNSYLPQQIQRTAGRTVDTYALAERSDRRLWQSGISCRSWRRSLKRSARIGDDHLHMQRIRSPGHR